MSDGNKLPDGWSAMTLTDFCEKSRHAIKRGPFGSTLKKEFFVSRGIKVYEQQNAIQNDFTLGDYYITPSKFNDLAAFEVKPGDLIISCSGTIGRIAVLPAWAEKGIINQALLKLTLNSQIIDEQFFIAQFQYKSATIVADTARGSGMANLAGVKELKGVLFFVPRLEEQRRIVAKVEELFSDLDAGVAALERAKANLKRYRAAVLKAAVEGKLTESWRAEHPATEPASKLLERIRTERRRKWESDQLAKFAAAKKQPPNNWKSKYAEASPPDTTTLPELPKGWCWAKLDQLLIYLRNGYFQSPSGAESGTPILRINAVRPMKVDLLETRYLIEINGSVDDYFIENGDLLFTRYNGSVDLLGVAGLVRNCTERVLHPDKLIRVKLAFGEPMPSFVEIAANVGVSRQHMAGRARTTAGQTGISGPDVRDMPIPLPPLVEQSQITREIAEKLSQIEAIEFAINQGLLRSIRLRQSILKQAFEGVLVAQDPADAPADKLLKHFIAVHRTNVTRGNETRTSNASVRMRASDAK